MRRSAPVRISPGGPTVLRFERLSETARYIRKKFDGMAASRVYIRVRDTDAGNGAAQERILRAMNFAAKESHASRNEGERVAVSAHQRPCRGPGHGQVAAAVVDRARSPERGHCTRCRLSTSSTAADISL